MKGEKTERQSDRNVGDTVDNRERERERDERKEKEYFVEWSLSERKRENTESPHIYRYFPRVGQGTNESGTTEQICIGRQREKDTPHTETPHVREDTNIAETQSVGIGSTGVSERIN